jgi:hypothetical protein
VLKADEATTERAKVLLPFGFTARQAHFLATVMLHSGVFVGRQYAAFAGITHGQKVHDFVEMLIVRRFVTPIELGSTGRTRIFHVHHKPLYAAIGEPDNRNRRGVTIDRAIQRLMILDGVLADRFISWLGSEREKRRYIKQRLGDSLPTTAIMAIRSASTTSTSSNGSWRWLGPKRWPSWSFCWAARQGCDAAR